ncbi:MAG: hypothetical protein AAGI46_17075, partial [Planctomycetota bacterium]
MEVDEPTGDINDDRTDLEKRAAALANRRIDLDALIAEAKQNKSAETVAQLKIARVLLGTFHNGFLFGGMPRYIARLQVAVDSEAELPAYPGGDLDFQAPGTPIAEMAMRFEKAMKKELAGESYKFEKPSDYGHLRDLNIELGGARVEVQLVDASLVGRKRPLIFRSDALTLNGAMRFDRTDDALQHPLGKILEDTLKQQYTVVAPVAFIENNKTYGQRVFERVSKKKKREDDATLLFASTKWCTSRHQLVKKIIAAAGQCNLEELQAELRSRQRGFRFKTLVDAVAAATFNTPEELNTFLARADCAHTAPVAEIAKAIAQEQRRTVTVLPATPDGTSVDEKPHEYAGVPACPVVVQEVQSGTGLEYDLISPRPPSLKQLLLGEGIDEANPHYGFRSTSLPWTALREVGAHPSRKPAGTLSMAEHVMDYDAIDQSPWLSMSKFLTMTIHWSQCQFYPRALQKWLRENELYRGPAVGPVQLIIVVNLPHYEALMREGLGVQDSFVWRADTDTTARRNGITGGAPLWSVTNGEIDAYRCIPAAAVDTVYVIDPDTAEGKKVLSTSAAPMPKD